MGILEPWLEEYGLVMSAYGMLGQKLIYVADPKALSYITTHSMDFTKPPSLTKNIMTLTGPGIFAVEGETNRRQVRQRSLTLVHGFDLFQ